MKNLTLVLAFLLGASDAATVLAQNPKYPPLSEYMMTPEAEISLARSAAPESVSARATVKILTASGYRVAAQGDNGFVCLVMRAWSAPTYTPAQFRDLVYDAGVRAPICFNPPAAKEVLPYYELRSKLGMEGKTPDQIRESVEAAYTRGQLPEGWSLVRVYVVSGSEPGYWYWSLASAHDDLRSVLRQFHAWQ
jgi:hypothetical protein